MYISFFEASKGPNAFTLGLLVWASVPYLVCLIIAFSGSERTFLGFCGATAALLPVLKPLPVMPLSGRLAIAKTPIPLQARLTSPFKPPIFV